jgi:hypothetical protein
LAVFVPMTLAVVFLGVRVPTWFPFDSIMIGVAIFVLVAVGLGLAAAVALSGYAEDAGLEAQLPKDWHGRVSSRPIRLFLFWYRHLRHTATPN